VVLPNPALAFGVDPHRREFYSLRQSRYDALAQDISDWAGAAAHRGEKLSVLDVGCGSGTLLRHLEAKPHFAAIAISATNLTDEEVYKRDLYQAIFIGDLTKGYAQIPSHAYDVVVCEQVFEHLPDLGIAIGTLERVLKTDGRLIVGVPIFPPPLHLLRKHVIPRLDRITGRRRHRAHVQAFSLHSFLAAIKAHSRLELIKVRGFRVISGGLLRPLENYRWWWKFNRKLGELVPAACIEIQAILRTPERRTQAIGAADSKEALRHRSRVEGRPAA
jgi:SAM-dependent methyltransferase